MKRVAVIGGGMTGLTFSKLTAELNTSIASIDIFDKGRKFGGRCNTKPIGKFKYDHGAQYCRPTDPFVQSVFEDMEQKSIAYNFNPKIMHFYENSMLNSKDNNIIRYKGVGGMANLTKYFENIPKIRYLTSHHVKKVSVENNLVKLEFRVHGEETDQVSDFYDFLVITSPQPQTIALLNTSDSITEYSNKIQKDISSIEMYPSYILMIAINKTTSLPDNIFVNEGVESRENKIFTWVSRENSTQRPEGTDSFVAHYCEKYSAVNKDKEKVKEEGVKEFLLLNKDVSQDDIEHVELFYWAYAKSSPCDYGYIWTPGSCLSVAGDYLLGGTIQNAMLSGKMLAEALVKFEVKDNE